jgi:hypothetical protein
MPQNPQLEQIQREVNLRFAPSNSLTRTIARKLARTLYEVQRNESLLSFAQSLSKTDLGRLTRDEQQRVRAKIREIRQRVATLEQQSIEYAEALSANLEAAQ